jgi:hypothetical protein
MNTGFNSAYVYIEDATGARYCQCFMRNDPASVESQKKHCRWRLHQRGTGVCRPAKIMVEFYHDGSAPLSVPTPRRLTPSASAVKAEGGALLKSHAVGRRQRKQRPAKKARNNARTQKVEDTKIPSGWRRRRM